MILKFLKVSGWIILGMITLCLLVYTGIYLNMKYRINKVYSEVVPEPIHVTYDSASVELGRKIVGMRACKDCHGADMGGRVMINDPLLGKFVTKNITHGKGGLPADFSEEDWVLALKHGLSRERKPLYLMPSHEMSLLTEEDMAAIIAYCSQLPNVDRIPDEFEMRPLGYILGQLDKIPLLPAEKTDHKIPFAKDIRPEISVKYGRYLSTVCINCHRENMKGGESLVPGGKYVADITSTGNPGKWTHEEFILAMHTGETPEGKKLKPQEMPWTITLSFSKEDLTALHLYLKSLK